MVIIVTVHFTVKELAHFLPLEGTHPYIGAVGEITKVAENRLETIVPKAQLATVLDAMKEAHPYEEVAYEVYRLAEPAQVATIGAPWCIS
ncbi:hypothetical protein [Veillonella criceti]|uniref:Uncharacterized protein conserved in bacteria n=1 Tax=Veillonella criceti TaxID=103891 RepID=A0A380NCN1_9FIRM|nr:hypothetical protein [Veillonella criceti]SUP37028.1 Uncharacterized protein conserved in bacteria [Veillonella criceti]